MLSHTAPTDPPTATPAAETVPKVEEKDETPPAPRLVIDKMVLKNFKSYAGRVEIGPFHKSFSSIVGPNGSGKSNVIDSLLFVFGFKAKKMRQGKLSELIHNSTNHQNLMSCSVTVHFHEIIDVYKDDYEIVPESAIAISRIVEKDPNGKADKSIYRINNFASSFTEVTKLLKSKGVDLDHKRFLILQGEVESISLMKPKAQNEHEEGLLEYLEDIIGTSRFKQPIEEGQKKLDELSQEKDEKVTRLKIVEKDKMSLESKKEETLEYVHLENELARKRNQLYQLRASEYAEQVTELTQLSTELTAQTEAEKEQCGQLVAEAKKLETTYKSHEKEFNDLSQKVELVTKELQKFDRTEIEFKEKEKHIQSKKKKLVKALQTDTHSQSEHQSWLANFENDIQSATSSFTELQGRMEKENAKFLDIQEGLKGKTEQFQTQIEAKQEEMIPWTEKVNSKQSEIDIATTEYTLLEGKINYVKNEVEKGTLRSKELKEQASSVTMQIKDVKKELASSTGQIQTLMAFVKECRMREDSAKSNWTAARQSVDDAKSASQSNESRGHLYTQLMRQSETGRINGVCGRLGSLGAIDNKYDVSVTTACGALDSIVVDNVESAQQCIEFLKKQNLGRANFICLDKIARRDMAPIATPDNAPRLFDLIKPKDKRFLPAFYQALNDTLVASDLEQANRIAFGRKRFRVVTLDGQLIDVSGTMSGGGSRPQKGGMSSKLTSSGVTESQMRDLESALEKSHQIYQEAKKATSAASQDAEAMKKSIPRLEMEVLKAESVLESSNKELMDLELHIQNLIKNEEPDQVALEKFAGLQKQIVKDTAELAKLQASADKLETQVKALQEKILEVGGVKLRTQKAVVDGIQDQIDTVNQRITKLKIEQATREKSLAKAIKSVDAKTTELADLDAELAQIKDDYVNQAEASKDIREHEKEIKKLLFDKQVEMEELKKKMDHDQDAVNEIRRNQVELKARLVDVNQKLAKRSKQIKQNETELKSLKLQLTGFEEEEVDTNLEHFDAEALAEMNAEHITKDISKLEELINKAKPNMEVLDEYKKKLEIYLARAKEVENVNEQRDKAKHDLDNLMKKRLNDFMTGFSAISLKLKEMYQMITMGGNAELELVDSLDPFSEGIVFSVMPPKKSWKNIANLSGGEKTLSSLALVFALHHFKPTPLYVMDEIDAALDFRNVSIVANYIKERTKNAQFVIISLRNNMFELADRLVGIYKTDNTTKSIAINPSALGLPS